MRWLTMTKTWAAAALCLTLLAPVWAQQMVSIKGSTVNMRSGPGTQNGVLWQLSRGYPLRVLEQKGRWLKVQDFEGDEGWVAQRMTGRSPHLIVKSPTANLRAGPGTQHRIVAVAKYGDVLRTEQHQAHWVRVQHNGRAAWIARSLVWGW